MEGVLESCEKASILHDPPDEKQKYVHSWAKPTIQIGLLIVGQPHGIVGIYALDPGP